MSIRNIAIALLLMVISSAIWRYKNSEFIQAIINPPPTKPATFEFDNGTVRQYDLAPPVAGGTKSLPLPVGALRKCRKGSEISYTNTWCAPGSKELPLTKGVVNVVEDAGVKAAMAKQASKLQRSGGASDNPTRNDEPSLRDKHIERVINR